MNRHSNQDDESPEGLENLDTDPVWDLLKKDASAHPVSPSPWFAARTAALVREQSPAAGFLRRWMIPIPFAALAAVVLAVHFAAPVTKQGGFVSSDEEFEQHMELLAYSE